MLQSPLKQGVVSRPRAEGFTLIELLMVIAVVLILAGITFGITRGVQNAQARATAKAELSAIAQGLEQFKAAYGQYPPIDNNMTGLSDALSGKKKLRMSGGDLSLVDQSPARDPFINEDAVSLTDPWGNNYVYIFKPNDASWDNFGYILYSEGPDRDSERIPTDGILGARAASDLDNIYAGE